MKSVGYINVNLHLRVSLCISSKKVFVMDKYIKTINQFCEERDWDQYHDSRNLAIGLVTEASELLELFRFKTDEQINEMFLDVTKKEQVEDELADVFFFLLRFASRKGISLENAFYKKMKKNDLKYPIDKCKGRNTKYNELT